MDDKKNNSPDEYQFPQDEYISPGDEQHHAFDVDPSLSPEGEAKDPVASDRKKNPIEFIRDNIHLIKNKRVLIGAGVLLLIILTIHFFSGPKESAIPSVATATSTATTAPVTQASPVTEPSNGSMLNSLSSLQEHSDRTGSDIRQLQSQMADMQNVIQQSQATNQQLQKTVDTLTAQLNTMSATLNQVLANQSKSKGGPKRIVYHLRAIQPDRAWITSSNGETLTVTLGDTIGKFGTVNLIDPVHGVVSTTGGLKVEYGPNDF